MVRERSARLGVLVIAAAVGGWVIGAALSFAAVTIRPSADGTLRDMGVGGVLDGLADLADWSFNGSSFEGAISLNTVNPATTYEDRVVWEYNLGTVGSELPVFAALDFTLRGAPAFPRPDVDVHVYAYDADLVERLADFHTGFSGGPAVFQGAVTVPPYQLPTAHSINVSGVVNDALTRGINKVAFRFQVEPDTPFTLNQAFIDALETDPTSKPYLTIQEAVPGDLTGDGEVDLADFASFYECMAGPEVGVNPGCEGSDLNRSHSVDLGDFQLLQSYFSNTYQ